MKVWIVTESFAVKQVEWMSADMLAALDVATTCEAALDRAQILKAREMEKLK